MKTMVLDVHEKPKAWKWIALSLQHLFAMFGATILVPLLTGLQPAVALFVQRGGDPCIPDHHPGQNPGLSGLILRFHRSDHQCFKNRGHGAALFGCFLAGIYFYGVVALIITRSDPAGRIMLPPVAIGSVVIVIGLSLAGTAVDMASTHQITQTLPDNVKDFQSLPGTVESIDEQAGTVTLKVYSLATFRCGSGHTVDCGDPQSVLAGISQSDPGSVGDCWRLFSPLWPPGMVDLSPSGKQLGSLRPGLRLEVSWTAALVIIPVALVTLAEHIGHLMVTSGIMNRDLTKDPGLHRSLLGDGVATSIASLFGGPPNTTYGENIGVMAITRIFSIWVIGGAAVIAIGFSFIGKLSPLISTIPSPVMGGVPPSLRHHRLRRSADVGGKPDGLR